MTTLVLALSLISFFLGEKIPAGGGLGYDGVIYANMTRNLGEMISDGELSGYYAMRVFPPTLVRCLILASGASFTNQNIIWGFEFYNLILLIGASMVWKKIADYFVISLSGRWIGFCGIFLSFMASKQTFYYPVLTDMTALFSGLLALLFYVERRPIALLATTICGAFAWQIAGICGALLLAFPRVEQLPGVVVPSKFDQFFGSIKIPGLINASLALSIAGVLILGKNQSSILTGFPSIICLVIAAAMLAGSFSFFRDVFAILCDISLKRFFLATMGIIVPLSISRLISNPDVPNAATLAGTLGLIFHPPSGKIFLPFVSLAVFWGPVVLLLLLNWRSFCIQARTLGPGFIAVIGLNLILCLATEPRFPTFAWPFFVLGTVLSMEKINKSVAFTRSFSVLVILYSQFWMIINLAPWTGSDYSHLSEFPKQLYFMHLGLWMNWWSYSIQLLTIFLSLLWLRSTLPSLDP